MKHRNLILTLLVAVFLSASSTTISLGQEDPFVVVNLLFFGDGSLELELTELGYVEGEDIIYPRFDLPEFTDPEFFAEYDRQLLEMLEVADVVVTNTDTDALNPMILESGVAIVFARSDDPVATGVVQDLIEPGGNITGTVTNRPHERRLQILAEINPETDMIYYLYSPLTGEAATVLAQVQAVADDLGIEVVTGETPDLPTALEALANTPEDADWLFLTPFVPFDLEFSEQLLAVSLEYEAGIAGVINQPTQGYVVGYGPDIAISDRQAAQIVDRILRGASPAELPVQTAENYLTINLEAAEVINLDIPENMLRQADLIIRPGFFDIDDQSAPSGDD